MLHSCFLALSGPCSFILTLGRIELITEGEADGATHLIIQLHGAKTAVYAVVALPGVEEVCHLEL